MTSRERVRRAVRFEGPDRIPLSHACLAGGLRDLGDGLRGVFGKYPSDFSGQYPWEYTLDDPTSKRWLSKCTWRDEWGSEWSYRGLGVEGMVIDGPFFKGWDGLDTFKPPAFEVGLQEPADSGTRYVRAGMPGGRLFERMHFLRGYENLLVDIMEDREEVCLLRDKLLRWTLEHLEPMLGCEWIDCFCYGDDWGTQRALMIPPGKWRSLFGPAYASIFSLARQAGKEVHFHSDGMILEIIPDLLEAGVTILNPQLSCIDLGELAKFKGKVCFAADMDRQHLLPFGTPEEIGRDVTDVIRRLSTPGGGMIGGAEIGTGVPLENADAVYRSFFEYRW